MLWINILQKKLKKKETKINKFYKNMNKSFKKKLIK